MVNDGTVATGRRMHLGMWGKGSSNADEREMEGKEEWAGEVLVPGLKEQFIETT